MTVRCGAVLDLVIARYAGKGQGELSMLRRLLNVFQPGDVLLADRLMCSLRKMAMLKQRDTDLVTRLSARRKADFRRGKRLGKTITLSFGQNRNFVQLTQGPMLRFQTFWKFERFVFEWSIQDFAQSASWL